MGVLGSSAKAFVEKVVGDSVGAYVIVQGGGFQGFPAAVADVLVETAGVAAVDRVRTDQAQLGGQMTVVTAVGRGVRLIAVDGDLESARVTCCSAGPRPKPADPRARTAPGRRTGPPSGPRRRRRRSDPGPPGCPAIATT